MSYNLMGYVDGSKAPPPRVVTIAATTEGAETQVLPNPAFAAWHQQDQVVVSGLLSSLSEEILGHVMFHRTAAEIWSELERMFASRSRAKTIQVRVQLANFKRNDMPVSDYFHKIKNLADTLSATGNPLSEEDVVSYVLAGLGSRYEALVASMTVRQDSISLGDLYGYLVSHEALLEQNASTNIQQQFSSSVNQASRGGGNYQGGGGRGRGNSGGRGGSGHGQQQGRNDGNGQQQYRTNNNNSG